MRKHIGFALFCIVMTAFSTVVNAQDAAGDKAKPQATAWSFYKLDFNVREMDNGKTLNTRSYTMNMRNGSNSQIRVGTRVPYTSEKGSNYMDVGFNVDCRIEDQVERGQALAITTDLTSLPADQALEKNGGLPLIRSLKSSSVIPITLNKPILVASVDEVGSTHRMQVEVTITQLK